MARRRTDEPAEHLPPDKAELAVIVRRAFDEPEGSDYGARIGNAVRAVMRARPEMTAPDALAAVRWLLRETAQE
jgi:hypothetical protein